MFTTPLIDLPDSVRIIGIHKIEFQNTPPVELLCGFYGDTPDGPLQLTFDLHKMRF